MIVIVASRRPVTNYYLQLQSESSKLALQLGLGRAMSEREVEARRKRPPMPEYDRFGFQGHFEPACGSGEDRSSTSVLRELNSQQSASPSKLRAHLDPRLAGPEF